LLIYIALKVDKELKIDPPIQVKYCLYGEPITFTFAVDGTKYESYFNNLSGVPGNIVEPPLKMIFEYKSFLTSKSHFMMDW
jgi:hypothetical protein